MQASEETTKSASGKNAHPDAAIVGTQAAVAGYTVPIALMLAMAGVCWHFGQLELIDDAYISFRYAENWAAGHGLVFNLGERVEGYTNFLWVVSLAAADVVGMSQELASQWLGAGFALLTVWAVWTFEPVKVRRAWWWRAVPVLFLLGNTAFSMWAMHGLETAMFCFWLTLALREDSRSIAARDFASDDDSPRFRTRTGLLYALAALTRPEGLLMFVAAIAYRLLSSPKSWLRRGGWRPAAVFAVIVGGHFAWRWSYYGWPLPNTYYAKVGMTSAVVERGWNYVVEFFWNWRNALLIVGLIPLAGLARVRRCRFWVFMAAAYLAIIILEGGDAFPGYRFIVPICPLLYILVGEGFAMVGGWLAFRWNRPPATSVALALATLGALGHALHIYDDVYYEVRPENDFTFLMMLAGRALAKHYPPDTTIALNPVGAVPYFSGFRAIDMLGLTDGHIAHTDPPDLGKGQAGHEKGDGKYILDQLPDLVLFGNVMILGEKPDDAGRIRWRIQSRSEREMAADPRLTQQYRPAVLRLEDGRYLAYLRRNDFAPATNIDDDDGM